MITVHIISLSSASMRKKERNKQTNKQRDRRGEKERKIYRERKNK